ncbi:MAG: LuxR C-terminal-related transcriptional regulator [Serratia sp. (in: enterobacteria)]|uniref:helix-turn-helix transcriptional regulator n=1 Tax=Serratia sp. (in: enterobacteria) TaxID=616 RepID=UPI003F3EFDD0
MNENKSMNSDQTNMHGTRTLVFFSDFAAGMGLEYILKNRSSVDPLRCSQEYFDRETEQHAMPAYELINYLLKLNSIQPKNKIIVLTENNDHIFLKLLASFDLFYLLSKKESLQFIHHAVSEPTDVFERRASPDIISKIGGRWENERLTHRQWFVLNQLAKSLSPAVIGGIWGLHVKTISTHKTNIMKKLGFTPWQFTQLLMMLGEVREFSSMEIKTPYYHEVKHGVAYPERDCNFTAVF